MRRRKKHYATRSFRLKSIPHNPRISKSGENESVLEILQELKLKKHNINRRQMNHPCQALARVTFHISGQIVQINERKIKLHGRAKLGNGLI